MSGLKLKNDIYSYLKNFEFMLWILLTTVLNFGYFLTHYSISVDDLNGARYYAGEMFAQGRFTSTILHYLFDLVHTSPWFVDFVGVVFLVLAAILFNILFDRLIPKISMFSKIIFSVLLITSPIHLELMIFNSCTLIIGIGFTLVALSLLLVQDYLKTKNKKNLVYSTILLMICVSWYESLLVVYFSAVFSILIVRAIYSENKFTFKDLVKEGLIYAIPFVASIVVEYVIQVIVMTVFSIERSHNSMNLIKLDSEKVFLISRFIFRYFWEGLSHFPITIYNISLLMGLLLCTYLVKQKKNFNFVLMFLCFFSSLFILCILMGEEPRYRMAQVIPYTVAYIFYLVSVLIFNSENLQNWKRIFLNWVAFIWQYFKCPVLIFGQILNL